jgi:hypothetical protein
MGGYQLQLQRLWDSSRQLPAYARASSSSRQLPALWGYQCEDLADNRLPAPAPDGYQHKDLADDRLPAPMGIARVCEGPCSIW